MSKDMPAAEFSRLLAVEDVGDGISRRIEAGREELEALARRMKLPAIHALVADLRITPEKRGGYMVRGQLAAEVEQECVRTLEVFPATVRADVERLFVPADSPAARALEEERGHELDPTAPDEPDILHEGQIDLGELVAECLALSLDPWPKKPGTDFVDMHSGAPRGEDDSTAEEGNNPFAVLRGLKGGGS